MGEVLDPVPLIALALSEKEYLLMQGRCIFEEISQVEEGAMRAS